jgi:prepilin-type N-terminal cleavage/methylation domain-containing protein
MVRRRGVTLFELMVALVVMTTAMMAIVQLLAMVASQRRMLEQRRAALTEVANQAERIALLPWNAVQSKEAVAWEFSAESRNALPQGTSTIEVKVETEPANSRRIRLLVRSPNSVGQMIELADLTVWKFAPGGEP